MAIPDWTNTEDWDVLYLGEKKCPGVATVSISMKSGIDTRKPRGGKKAAQKDVGAPPAQVDIELEMMPNELDEFSNEIVPLLRPKNVFAPRDPISIGHPQARIWNVNVVIGGEIKSPHPTTGGTIKVSFTVEEWAPQPTTVNKSADKPKDDNDQDGHWNVRPLIDALRPGRAKGASRNLGDGLARPDAA
jgi:hypothetical protein